MGCGASKTVGAEVAGAPKPEPAVAQERLLAASVVPQAGLSDSGRRESCGLLLLKDRGLLDRRDGRLPRRNTVQHLGLHSLATAAQTPSGLLRLTTSPGFEQSTEAKHRHDSSLKKSVRRESSCANFSQDKIKMDQSIQVAISNPQLRTERVQSSFRITSPALVTSRKNSSSSTDRDAAGLSKPPIAAGPSRDLAAVHRGKQCAAAAPGLDGLKPLEKTSTERSIISTRPYRRFNFLQNDCRLPEDSLPVRRDAAPVCSPQGDDASKLFPTEREEAFSRASAFKRVEVPASPPVESLHLYHRATAGNTPRPLLDLSSQSSKLLDSAGKASPPEPALPAPVDRPCDREPRESLSLVCRRQTGLPPAKDLRVDRNSHRSGAGKTQATPDESLLPHRQESRGSRHFSDTRITRASQSSAVVDQPSNERFAELFKTRRHEIRRGNYRQKQGSVSSLGRFTSRTPDIPRFQSPTVQLSAGSFGLFQAKSLEQSFTVHVTTISARPAAKGKS